LKPLPKTPSILARSLAAKQHFEVKRASVDGQIAAKQCASALERRSEPRGLPVRLFAKGTLRERPRLLQR
jgi:hypothetical protein